MCTWYYAVCSMKVGTGSCTRDYPSTGRPQGPRASPQKHWPGRIIFSGGASRYVSGRSLLSLLLLSKTNKPCISLRNAVPRSAEGA